MLRTWLVISSYSQCVFLYSWWRTNRIFEWKIRSHPTNSKDYCRFAADYGIKQTDLTQADLSDTVFGQTQMIMGQWEILQLVNEAPDICDAFFEMFCGSEELSMSTHVKAVNQQNWDDRGWTILKNAIDARVDNEFQWDSDFEQFQMNQRPRQTARQWDPRVIEWYEKTKEGIKTLRQIEDW